MCHTSILKHCTENNEKRESHYKPGVNSDVPEYTNDPCDHGLGKIIFKKKFNFEIKITYFKVSITMSQRSIVFIDLSLILVSYNVKRKAMSTLRPRHFTIQTKISEIKILLIM